MKIKIIHLYPDSMSLYGEYANLAVLKRHIEAAGAEAEMISHTFEDGRELAAADMIYMGAGTEGMQKAVLSSLDGECLKKAAEDGSIIFFTGNAMETLGASVTDMEGKSWAGFGLADFKTVERDRRISGDVIAHSPYFDEPAVGFMNKRSTTCGIKKPLFERLSLGFGNEEMLGEEGYCDGNVIGTHVTGPALVKNPAFLKFMMNKLFSAVGFEPAAELAELPHERESYAVTLSELQKRVKK